MSKTNQIECFTVHVYPRIRVTMKGIKAGCHAAAAEIAATALCSTNWDGVRGRDFATLVEA